MPGVVHFVLPMGAMAHALPDVTISVLASPDRTRVTCPICVSIINDIPERADAPTTGPTRPAHEDRKDLPMKFRKKPVVIEAMAFIPGRDPNEIIDWIVGHAGTASHHKEEVLPETLVEEEEIVPEHILIETLEGDMRASVGDWIIKGVNNEFYPCKPDIFVATYEKAEEADGTPISPGAEA